MGASKTGLLYTDSAKSKKNLAFGCMIKKMWDQSLRPQLANCSRYTVPLNILKKKIPYLFETFNVVQCMMLEYQEYK